MLSIVAREDEHNWDLKLPTLLLAYRTSVHETTGETPSLLMLGREARLPVDIMYNLAPNKKDEPSGYAETLKANISQAYDRVHTRMDREQSRQKAVCNQSSDDRKYSIGEKVWLHCPAVPRGRSPKFHRPWRGPYTVVKVLDKAVYRIQCNGMAHYYGKHSPALKPTGTSPTESGDKIQQPNNGDDNDDSDLLIDVQVQRNTNLECPAQSLPEIEDKAKRL
jgi:hypothetical protein